MRVPIFSNSSPSSIFRITSYNVCYTKLLRDTKRHVELEAMDAESLLVEWLSELAYWAETEMLIFHRFELYNVTPNHLQAVIHGGHASGFKKHIKAVTYHNLEVIETEKGLEATVVFDV